MAVLVLATFETKREEAEHLIAALGRAGLPVERIDLSLRSGGAQWSAPEKLAGMARAAARATEEIAALPQRGRRVAVALGGGTGGQIALEVLRALPEDVAKVMVTTMPFDPRQALADSAIILVPTVADLCGLNATTRTALDRAAAIARGLLEAPSTEGPEGQGPSVGVTALGVTGPGTDAICARLRAEGREVTVFHANGFGGAAFARWARNGAFDAVVDYTPHEVTRLHVAGVHAAMPDRFTAMGHLPRVVLPGGVNFLGLGAAALLDPDHARRPRYAHSPLFTHVKCTPEEVALCARALGRALAQATAPVRVLVPMGGFSSEDRPGGAIEDEGLRALFADTLEGFVRVRRLATHINDAATADAAADALRDIATEAA